MSDDFLNAEICLKTAQNQNFLIVNISRQLKRKSTQNDQLFALSN